MHSKVWLTLGLGALAAASAVDLAPRQTAAPTESAETPEVTAITSCHLHGADLFCFVGDDEYHVQTTPTSDNYPAEFTGCHAHGEDLYCIGPDGEEVEAVSEAAEAEGDDHEGHDHEEGEGEDEHAEGESSNQHCHFHAGVEHCTGGDESESEGGRSCDATPRDYNVGLRVGLLFAILATSALGVFAPILIHKYMPSKLNLIFVLLKQFGTGIIISTAFVHLYTHASLMFTNECIGDLGYEGTTSAIVMAGIFMSFVVEYIGQRIVIAKVRTEATLSFKERSQALLSSEVVSILVMESGIVFHSVLIGLTLVVSGDSFFITLFIVILFHQMFEGIALGSRIATIGTLANALTHSHSTGSNPDDADKAVQQSAVGADDSTSTDSAAVPLGLSMRKKLTLAALFAFVTPIGMAIGIGVLKHFNGNDRSTLVAIGTLDALSSGILVWVGVVEMWAGDWMTGAHGHKAELADANLLTVAIAGFGLISGLVVMSVLGMWA